MLQKLSAITGTAVRFASESLSAMRRNLQFEVTGAEIAPAAELATADTLEAVRSLVPAGLVRLPRDPADDPVVYESWV